jgi:putative tryptophan/tyrosine transport system substrate-binding protein
MGQFLPHAPTAKAASGHREGDRRPAGWDVVPFSSQEHVLVRLGHMQFGIGRRQFISALGGAATAWPLVARAQQPPVPVIGYLAPGTPEPDADLVAAFRTGLSETGYVESRNVVIEFRWAENDSNRLPVLAADLVRQGVNVIVAISAPVAVIAAKVTTTVPIVFLVPEDPVKLGLVTSLSRPGGNMTGVNIFASELAAKRLELLRTMVPTATRVAALFNPAEPNIAATNLRAVEAAAGTMGLQLRVLNASTIADIDAAFATFANERPDALFISSGPFFTNRRVQLAQLAARYKVPAINLTRSYPEVGGLMSYGTDLSDAFHQVGIYTGNILKGAKPADLPVVQSTKFELVINLKTAKALGIEVPQSLLVAADEVIE